MIPKEELHITYWRHESSVPRQVAGYDPVTVRVVHKPTGIAAEVSHGRSQLKMLETAIEMIEWGLSATDWKRT